MEVITIESKAYKEIVERINSIAIYVESTYTNLDDIWVDNYEVCTFLRISERTLYRLRKNGEIPYSVLSGKIYYTIGDIKRTLDEKKIKSDNSIECLVENHQKYTEQRRVNRKIKK